MKKVLLSLAAVFAFGFANAQEMKFGAKASLGLSSISGLDNAKSKLGFEVGGFAEIGIADKFYFQPELVYSAVGAKTERTIDYGGGEIDTYKTNMKLSYLNIPLMVKYTIAEKINLEAGPQVGFLMSAKSDTDYTSVVPGDPTITASTSTDVKSAMKSTAFSFNIGGGYDITENFSAGLRYTVGLTQLQKNLIANESASKVNALWLNLAYKF